MRSYPHPQNDQAGMHIREFSSIYEEHAGPIFAYAYNKLRNPELAQDIVSDTFEQALLSRGGYSPKGPIRNWLMAIARAAISERLRKNAVIYRQEQPLDLLEESEPGHELPNPDDFEEEIANNDLVVRLVNRLPPAQRQAVILRHLGQCSVPEIAARMGIAEGTVHKDTMLGMKRLREYAAYLSSVGTDGVVLPSAENSYESPE